MDLQHTVGISDRGRVDVRNSVWMLVGGLVSEFVRVCEGGHQWGMEYGCMRV